MFNQPNFEEGFLQHFKKNLSLLGELRQVISNYNTKELFLDRARKDFAHDSDGYNKIVEACSAVEEQNGNRKRKNGDGPITHEIGIATILLVHCKCIDADLIVSALLHDLVEDYQDWTVEKVYDLFGKKVATIVDAVTKPERNGEDDKTFNRMIFDKVTAGGPDAIWLKCADRLHNMLTLCGFLDAMRGKISQTFKFVIPMAYGSKILFDELLIATYEQMYKVQMRAATEEME